MNKMTILERFEKATTVKDLYILLLDLQTAHEVAQAVYLKSRDFDDVQVAGVIGYFVKRVEFQISYLESRGIFLNNIYKPAAEETAAAEKNQ